MLLQQLLVLNSELDTLYLCASYYSFLHLKALFKTLDEGLYRKLYSTEDYLKNNVSSLSVYY